MVGGFVDAQWIRACTRSIGPPPGDGPLVTFRGFQGMQIQVPPAVGKVVESLGEFETRGRAAMCLAQARAAARAHDEVGLAV